MSQGSANNAAIKVGMISLGCAKNLVDAEIMLGTLMREGMTITNDAALADVVIVNTCSFIDSAQEESVDAILQSAELRAKTRPGQALVVSGCLPQRFRDELPALIPEVDAFMGIDQVERVGEIVRGALLQRQARGSSVPSAVPGRKAVRRRIAALDRERPPLEVDPAPAGPRMEVSARPVYIPDYETPRFRLTPRHFAYVKIAEGCNHPCSFCIIPRMRGSHRSRSPEDIVKEVKGLVAGGVKEINLISQDTTYYGLDLRPVRAGSIAAPDRFREASLALPPDIPTLSRLLRELNRLPGDFWIRLLYTHPAHWTDELIDTIASCEKVARYVDMPLQHIHENMLERMRRETSRAYIEDLIGKMRARIPGIALRTTFIVGFPGETDDYFLSLLEFIRTARFERMGVFAYSQEEGTRAARMERQVPEAIRLERRELAMAEQRTIAREHGASAVGRLQRVLVEGPATASELREARVASWERHFLRGQPGATPPGKFRVARGQADAPDIDGRVYVRGPAPEGDFATVRVVGHTDYDLVAEQVSA